MWRLFLISLLFATNSVQAYKAAVVEYRPQILDSANATILKNLEEYQSYADRAKTNGVDILVFPEYGLTSITTNSGYAIEINNSSHVIRKLSAIAKERDLYLVVNLLEKDQDEYYNTNLVFDRNGAIILKYRKINLDNESWLKAGSSDQKLTFNTNFGTTFGVFTGNDIVFRNPSRTVLENPSVANVVYPTAWESRPPFYHSLSVQNGYAKANGVNLLAASYGKPEEGYGGSAIHFSDGKVGEAYIDDTPSSKSVMQQVVATKKDTTVCPTITAFGLPGEQDRLNVTNYKTTKSFSAESYQFQDLDLSQSHTVKQLCDRNFCCEFDVLLNTSLVNPSEVYKFMAFDNMVKYGETDAHIRICSLVACETQDVSTCGNRFNTTSKFTKITVKGNVPNDETAFYSPITLNYYLLPMTETSFCNTKNGTNSTFVQLSSMKAPQNVLAFGLFGRTDAPVEQPEERDDNGDGGDGGNSAVSVQAALVCTLLVVLVEILKL